MYSLETMLPIAGDPAFADQLERIAYNALPAQTTEDFRARQYFQCANQVLVTRARRNFYEEDYHQGTDLCFGLLTGYPCCTCNMHQGWPKFVQNLWYATDDGGFAALVYSPCSLETRLPGGVTVRIREETEYPFEEQVRFRIEPSAPVEFPLRLRIPDWATAVELDLNGQGQAVESRERIMTFRRIWKPGDQLTVRFAAQTRVSRWAENSVAVERGPLVYALRMQEDWRAVKATDAYGDYLEILSGSPWNFGLLEADVNQPAERMLVRATGAKAAYPWTVQGAPLEIRLQAKRIPEWQLYKNMAGPLPHSRPQLHLQQAGTEAISLIPYGCTRLRITEFPVVR
jgi:hypothetical protein